MTLNPPFGIVAYSNINKATILQKHCKPKRKTNVFYLLKNCFFKFCQYAKIKNWEEEEFEGKVIVFWDINIGSKI